MIPWAVAWNNIWTRPGRTFLTIFSVAIGISSIVAVLQATISTRTRLRDISKALAPKAALNVVAVEDGAFPQAVVDIVRAVPGVRAAVETFSPTTVLYNKKVKVEGMVVGVDLDGYRRVRNLEITEGRKYEDPSEICLDAGAADALGVKVGDEVEVQTRAEARPVPHTVVGIVTMLGVSKLDENAVAFWPLAEAQQSWERDDELSAIHIVVDESSTSDIVAGDLSQKLPKSVAVRKVQAVAGLEHETELLVFRSLNVAATLSVVAAVFIVLNTFMIGVAERQRQFALMRIVGATVEQIQRLMYQESLLLSLVGTVAGAILGTVGGAVISRGIQAIFGVDLPKLPTNILPIVAGILCGPLITFVAMIYPAVKASRVSPLSILSEAPALLPPSKLRYLTFIGLSAFILAVVLYTGSFLGYIKPEVTLFALPIGMFACVLAVPLTIKPTSLLLYSVQPKSLAFVANLARLQVTQRVTQSALTVGVVFVVTCADISIGNTTALVSNNVKSWYDRTMIADFLVRPNVQRIDLSPTESVPPVCDEQIANIDGITTLDRVAFAKVTLNNTPTTLMTRQFEGYQTVPLNLDVGNPDTARDALLAGDVILGSVIAQRLGLGVGSEVTVETENTSHKFRVAGIAAEYTGGGAIAIMDRNIGQRRFGLSVVHAYVVGCAAETVDQVGHELKTLSNQHKLILEPVADFRRSMRNMTNGVTSGLWLQLTLGMVVAAFGIVNTLTMNVLEQTRYFGLLRAIGMTRAQIGGIVVYQALMIGLSALLPGTILGVVLAAVTNESFRILSGHAITFRLQPLVVGGYFLVGLFLVVLAALPPALRAANLSPLEAIHED